MNREGSRDKAFYLLAEDQTTKWGFTKPLVLKSSCTAFFFFFLASRIKEEIKCCFLQFQLLTDELMLDNFLSFCHFPQWCQLLNVLKGLKWCDCLKSSCLTYRPDDVIMPWPEFCSIFLLLCMLTFKLAMECNTRVSSLTTFKTGFKTHVFPS